MMLLETTILHQGPVPRYESTVILAVCTYGLLSLSLRPRSPYYRTYGPVRVRSEKGRMYGLSRPYVRSDLGSTYGVRPRAMPYLGMHFLRSLILYEPVAFIGRSEYERQQHRSAQPDRDFLVLYIYLGIVILTWLTNDDHVSIE